MNQSGCHGPKLRVDFVHILDWGHKKSENDLLIRHDVHIVDMVNRFEIEVSQIPETGWGGKRDNIFNRLLFILVIKLFEELDKIWSVLLHAASVIGTGVLLRGCELKNLETDIEAS